MIFPIGHNFNIFVFLFGQVDALVLLVFHDFPRSERDLIGQSFIILGFELLYLCFELAVLILQCINSFGSFFELNLYELIFIFQYGLLGGLEYFGLNVHIISR